MLGCYKDGHMTNSVFYKLINVNVVKSELE